MSDFYFISYSSLDLEFALKLADELTAGPPSFAVWLDKRLIRPGEDWDEQVADAITSCKGMLFAMSEDSVGRDSVCKGEWVRALKYKKPIVPLLLASEAELPLRLGSRQFIDFTGGFDEAMAKLRKHLVWLESAEGKLQSLSYRLSDARRELARAEEGKQARVREDIVELERQIALLKNVIENPKAAEQRIQQSISAALEGERQPVKAAGGITAGKFVNQPPLIAPSWFMDRTFETRQIGDFLKEESLRLMTVVGRGGVGKTAMVCRLLRSLEAGQLPDDGGALTVDGIVYLSAARSLHRPNFPDLYAGLTELLPEESVAQIDTVYKNPQSSTRATMERLTAAFPRGRTVVLLDNLEDLMAVETGEVKDAELGEVLRALLELPPHGLKIVITTRVALRELAFVQPGLQRRLDLDAGLDHPYAEELLRTMDADGKLGLRNAPIELLGKARERTLGYPRALEHLYGILSADRDTSLEQILNDTRKLLPEQVVEVLVGEAFSRLDLTAQCVMQALATYRYPVPPAAVDYLLQPYVAGIESSRVLSRLVNMQFVRRDTGRYYLHQVDRDYALSRLDKGGAADRTSQPLPLTCFALRHRAAEWFKLSRKPRAEWKTLGDLAAQICEFELRCEGEDYDTAAALLLEFDFDYLNVWGHYRLMVEYHERLQGKVSDLNLAGSSAGNLGLAYDRSGQIHKALGFYEQALELARKRHDVWGEAAALGNYAGCLCDLGEYSRGIEHLEETLALFRKIGVRKGEATALGNLANRYSEIGLHSKAVGYYDQALVIDREERNRLGEGNRLSNIGDGYRILGRADEALRCHTEALEIAREIGYRLLEAVSHAGIGESWAMSGDWEKARGEYEEAIEIADEIGFSETSRDVRQALALGHLSRNELAKAREIAEDAQKYDVPLRNHSSLAMLGLVAVRQGDGKRAKECFESAIEKAGELIALTPQRYEALDTKGLAHCGLAVCGDLAQVEFAKQAYMLARSVTSEVGPTRDALEMFDALAQADAAGVVDGVRLIAAGKAQAGSAGV